MDLEAKGVSSSPSVKSDRIFTILSQDVAIHFPFSLSWLMVDDENSGYHTIHLCSCSRLPP